jgi:hypothetical protein
MSPAQTIPENAVRPVRNDGIIVWDNYGDFWPGAKRAVNE